MIQVQNGPEPNWEALSREWEKSSQNQMDFCRERGLSYSQFKNARARLGHCRPKRKPKSRRQPKAAAVKPSNLSFLPLAVETEPASPRQNQALVESRLEVELPFGVVLRFNGVDSGQ